MKLEIIGFNIESCIAAQEAGAHRIELCDNPSEGGTTPSDGFIKGARKKLSIEFTNPQLCSKPKIAFAIFLHVTVALTSPCLVM